MPRSNALVDQIRQIAGPAPAPETAGEPRAEVDRFARVEFAGGATASLDLTDRRAEVWLSVLGNMRDAGLAAYVEVDPASSTITELLSPLAVTVGELRPTDDGVDVELLISHARHRLSRSNPDFADLLAELEAARAENGQVLVTETLDTHEIIDVRRVVGPLLESGLSGPSAGRPAGSTDIEGGPEVGPPGVAGVSPEVAQKVFTLVNSRLCNPVTAVAPCIPFNYPDDGCWGRAHEMCRLMIAAGVQPYKVWIYGNLHAGTVNNPNCVVYWGWHVAPVLMVDTPSGTVAYVVDPSLFAKPVPVATWAAVQGDPAAKLAGSTCDAFYRGSDGSTTTDPTYTETNKVLAYYRTQLQLRSAAYGPPPYARCMPGEAAA